MNRKLLNLALILTSLIGYLEWGGGNSTFLFQAEADVLATLFSDPLSAAHPLTLLPLLGQVLLVVTLFQKKPAKALTFIALGCLGILLLLVFFIGILGTNVKMVLSVLPFLIVSAWTIREFRGRKTYPGQAGAATRDRISMW